LRISQPRISTSVAGCSCRALAHSADQDGVERWQLWRNAGHAACKLSAFQPGKSCHATGTQRELSRVTLPVGVVDFWNGALAQAVSVLTITTTSHLATRPWASVREALAGRLFIVD
jgi:hypothetical protein